MVRLSGVAFGRQLSLCAGGTFRNNIRAWVTSHGTAALSGVELLLIPQLGPGVFAGYRRVVRTWWFYTGWFLLVGFAVFIGISMYQDPAEAQRKWEQDRREIEQRQQFINNNHVSDQDIQNLRNLAGNRQPTTKP